MARTIKVKMLALLAVFIAAPLSAFAQAPQDGAAAAGPPSVSVTNETPGVPLTPQQLSAQCAVPTSEIAAPAPLPATIVRLEGNQPLRILAIGSSSTWGVGATSRRKNYPSQLEAMLERVLKTVPIEVVNRGVSGETAEATADRLRIEAALLRPDLVLWQVGTNAVLRDNQDESWRQSG